MGSEVKMGSSEVKMRSGLSSSRGEDGVKGEDGVRSFIIIFGRINYVARPARFKFKHPMHRAISRGNRGYNICKIGISLQSKLI